MEFQARCLRKCQNLGCFFSSGPDLLITTKEKVQCTEEETVQRVSVSPSFLQNATPCHTQVFHELLLRFL